MQYPMIYIFKIFGPLIATNLGMLVIIFMAIEHLKINYNFNQDRTRRRFIGITAFSVIMFLLVLAVEKGLELFLNPASSLQSLVIVFVAVVLGCLFYGFAAIKSNLAQKILGNKIIPILEKLHIRV